jgi:acetylornithine deacetylase/succinyl-diaminopimelate desuccinylase-like protein
MGVRILKSAAAGLALAALATSALAADAYDAQAKRLMGSRSFAVAKANLAADYDRTIQDVITLTEIPAPPFKEEARGRKYLEMLKAHGLSDVEMDAEGNVMGVRKGTGGGPLIAIAAHMDTVFPEGTDTKVRREGDTLYAPGIGDDTSGLAALLAYVRALDAAQIRHKADILIVGDVGEEGPGDLRGMKYLFNKGKYAGKISAFISFEPGGERITNGGTGSRRYRIAFKGPGGHSYGAFGLVSPAYAMGQAMFEIGKLQVPASPKTTYSIGVIGGGTSVNSIPFESWMEIDMRSEGKDELADLERRLLATLQPAADAENAARSTAQGKITVEPKLIGDRPVGRTAETTDLVRIAAAVLRANGREVGYSTSSTDANLPMSLGIPAVTLGSGFQSRRAHALDEALDIAKDKTVANMAMGLATVILLAQPVDVR